MPKKPLGRNCTLAAYTSSSTSTVTIQDILDVTINDECETVDLDVRGQTYKTTAVLAKSLTIDFNMKARVDSTGAALLLGAYNAGSDVYIKITEPSSNRVLDDVMVITKMNEVQNLGDFVEHSITLAHANFDAGPTRSDS